MIRTDDPVRDFERWDAEQETILQKRDYLVCDLCGGKIYKTDGYADGDDYYDFDGDLVCEDCVSDYLRERKVRA